jgi:anti-sigma regulatory factor (Ser/Thr protein kinase)
LDRLGFALELRDQLVLAVDEAAANVIRHGYQNDLNGKLELSAWIIGEQLHVLLRDQAPAIDPGCVKPRDLDECKVGGLGINLIDMSFDHWHFERPSEGVGNVLTMVKKLPL